MSTEDRLSSWERPTKEDCPICCVPLPVLEREKVYWDCCGKTVCYGCVIAQAVAAHESKSKSCHGECYFCRHPLGLGAKTDKKTGKKKKGGRIITCQHEIKFAEEGNRMAMYKVADYYYRGEKGLKKNKDEAIKWYHRAIDAGCADAALGIARYYEEGDGVPKDDDKYLFYLQKACDLGSPLAFLRMCTRYWPHDMVNVMLNYRKAAICGLGGKDIFEELHRGYRYGHITKEEYAATLREHQATLNEMKSDARDRYKEQFYASNF